MLYNNFRKLTNNRIQQSNYHQNQNQNNFISEKT